MSSPKVNIRLKVDILIIYLSVNNLNLAFPSGSSLKYENAELFLVGLSASEWFVGQLKPCKDRRNLNPAN